MSWYDEHRPLTPVQRRILWLLRENDGRAAFQGGTRGFHWGLHEDHGLVITAYGDPEMFLENRGLIEKLETNAPGRWFRLTAAGETRAKRLKAYNPPPKRRTML